MLSVEQARITIVGHITPLASRPFSLDSSAVGLVLAEDIYADRDLPPFPKAMMDGFAVRAEDCSSHGTVLNVVEEISAGQEPRLSLATGQAARIMTGAALPNGANAVVMIEECEYSAAQVKFQSPVRACQHVQPVGREMRRAAVVVKCGTQLRPAHLGIMAAIGRISFTAIRRPTVAVLTTGNEIVEPDQTPSRFQIRNSNGPMIQAQCALTGASVRYIGIAKDTEDDLTNKVEQGLSEDVLILSGGVSAGKLDLVPTVLKNCGVDSHVHKIHMKPGKPLYFGTRRKTLVFGLPGNPVSSFVGFELFVRPAIEKLMGVASPFRELITLPLASSFSTKADRPTYHPACIVVQRGEEHIQPIAWHGSPDLVGLSSANALAVLEPGERTLAVGTPINVHRLPK